MSNAWKSRVHIAGAAAFHLGPMSSTLSSFHCRLLLLVGRPKRSRTTTTTEEEAAKLNERRAAELKRLGPSGRRPPFKIGRPSLQSLYEGALYLKVRTDPDSARHITDNTVPNGWKRGMSVFADVHEVFACPGHAVIEKHEQEHEQEHAPAAEEPAAAEPPHKKQRTPLAEHHIQWFLRLADRLHVHGWRKKDVFMNCQRWGPEGNWMALAGVVDGPRRSLGLWLRN